MGNSLWQQKTIYIMSSHILGTLSATVFDALIYNPVKTSACGSNKTGSPTHVSFMVPVFLLPGPANRPVHRPGVQRSLPGVPESQWHQPRGPESEGVQWYYQHPGDVQWRPHSLLQLWKLQRGWSILNVLWMCFLQLRDFSAELFLVCVRAERKHWDRTSLLQGQHRNTYTGAVH